MNFFEIRPRNGHILYKALVLHPFQLVADSNDKRENNGEDTKIISTKADLKL